MEIFFKSDFEVIEQFLDANGEPLDVNTLNIELCYETDKYTSYSASFRNGHGLNCYIDEDDNSKLHVTFAEHKLAPGTLTRTVTFFVDNNRFPDNTENIRMREHTDVELVRIGGNNSSFTVADNVTTILLFNHAAATHRDDEDSHPISAITGLREALDNAGERVLTDYANETAYVGRNSKSASTSEETWSIKVIYYANDVLQVSRFANVSWDNRYNLI